MILKRFILLWFLAFLVGCERLDTEYATYRGESINGVRFFAETLRKQGYDVDVWPSLGDQLFEGYDLIIIFHHEYGPPSEEAIAAIWEHDEFGEASTLLFVGRDLDVTPRYWSTVSKILSEKGNQEEAETASKVADEELAMQKAAMSFTYDASFTRGLVGVKVSRQTVEEVTSVSMVSVDSETDQSGEVQEKEPVVSRKSCDWPVYRMLEPPEGSEIAWKTKNGDPLLVSIPSEYAYIYVMHSAYPFLNGGLAQKENRKLVNELMDELAPDGKVAIVSSSRVLSGDQQSQFWRFLKVFPHPWIATHLLLFAFLFCLWRFPIFGRPRRVIHSDLKRFGAHIEALGELFRKTGNRVFAVQRIQSWKEKQKNNQKPGIKK